MSSNKLYKAKVDYDNGASWFNLTVWVVAPSEEEACNYIETWAREHYDASARVICVNEISQHDGLLIVERYCGDL